MSWFTLTIVGSNEAVADEDVDRSRGNASSGQTSQDLHPGEKRLVLLVATVSAIAALAGAAVGGYATYRTATLQAKSESNREEKARRLAAYSDYLTAVAVYKNLSYRFVTGFHDNSLRTWEARNAIEKDLGPAFLDAQRKGGIVQLVCVENVCPVTDSLKDSTYQLNQLIYDLQYKANEDDWASIGSAQADLNSKFSNMQDREIELRAKAHDDLTSE